MRKYSGWIYDQNTYKYILKGKEIGRYWKAGDIEKDAYITVLDDDTYEYTYFCDDESAKSYIKLFGERKDVGQPS